jgi:MraZ protein
VTDFSGSYEHGLDSKGRVIIPMCFREGLGENFAVALNGTATAIALYPQEQWEHVKNRLARVSATDELGMEYKRFFNGNAFTGNTMDAQGRVLLPGKLRALIGITKDLVFVGMTETIEIWDAKAHGEREQQARTDIKSLMRHMEERYS